MIEFDADFQNASLGPVTRLAEDWYQVGLRPDTTYWTHFRIRGCRGREITFNLTFVSRTHANRWGLRDTGNPEAPDYACRNPYYSYDGKTWQHFDHAAGRPGLAGTGPPVALYSSGTNPLTRPVGGGGGSVDTIRLGLVGCGGMGTRHIYGIRELARSPFCNIELAGLCDLRRENAEQAAGEAEQLLGTRPPVFTSLEEMVRSVPDLAAVDVVTDPSVHHGIVCQALDLGLHVLVEKPLAITVRTCRMMIDAAARNNRLLSVAENYRRDPSARLVKHLLEGGAIGQPYLGVFHSVSPGRDIFITPWRHLKDRGGPLVDMGVHFTDLIRYQLGDVAEVYGDVRLLEPQRHKPDTLNSPYAFYRDRHRDMAAAVPATAEDMSVAVYKMASGAVVNWVVGVGGTGRLGGEQIMGGAGTISGFGTRGGRTSLATAAGEQDFEALVEARDDFGLEPLAAHFFPTRMAAGDPAVDWKLLALELYELGEAILHGRALEVDGLEGLKDVAAVYAIFESSLAGRAVTMDEVESGQLYAYQADIDTALGVS